MASKQAGSVGDESSDAVRFGERSDLVNVIDQLNFVEITGAPEDTLRFE